MPFVKIDCGMINSTIWYDHDARIIFLTALLMAEPREYERPAPQLAVRDLEPSDWSAPPGWYGFVPSSAQGLISRAGNVSPEAGYAALERLGAPEKESRSPMFEGRRMIRVDGGYLILNYDRFRQRDYSAADRQRKWREKNAAERNALRNVTEPSPTRLVTQAEAEGQKQRKKEPLVHPDELDALWSEYPRKRGKAASLKLLRSQVKTREALAEMRGAIANYRREVEILGSEERFILHGSTFFGGRWRDYVEGTWKPPEPKGKPKQAGLPRFTA